MNGTIEKLVELLAVRSYREGDVQLASGRRSSAYIDAKQVTYDPEGFALAGRAVYEIIAGYGVAGVGGLTMGADAIVCATLSAAAAAGDRIPGFIVRKEPKKHGLQKWIEGIQPPPGSRVAIVEDVVTSGGSALKAVAVAREAGLEVAVVVPLVDREEGGREAVEAEGLVFRPVCTMSQVREAARRLAGAADASA